jgi:hypothetical protein
MKKIIALLLTGIFSITQGVYASPSAFSIKVNEESGKVTQRFRGESEATIIHIQDAHSSFEAQKNLASLIQGLVLSDNPDLTNISVGVEGAIGEVDVRDFRQFPVPGARRMASERFVKEGVFTGSELAAVSAHESIQLFGLEDKELFKENYDAFYTVSAKQSELESEIASLEECLNLLKGKCYNQELRAFDAEASAYERNQTLLMSFLGTLYKGMQDTNIDYMSYVSLLQFKEVFLLERSIDFGVLDTELKKLAETLAFKYADIDTSRANEINERYRAFSEKEISRQALASYLYALGTEDNMLFDKYVMLKKAIIYWRKNAMVDMARLMSDIVHSSAEVRERLAKTSAEKTLVRIHTKLVSLRQLLSLSALKEDVALFRADKGAYSLSRIIQDIEGLSNALGVPVSLPKNSIDMDTLLNDVDLFYTAAEKRDEVMVRNLLSRMMEQGSSVGILVAGGYHSDGIVELLRNTKTSFVTVMPTISSTEKDVAYMARMMGSIAPLNLASVSHLNQSKLNMILQNAITPDERGEIVNTFNGAALTATLNNRELQAELVLGSHSNPDPNANAFAREISAVTDQTVTPQEIEAKAALGALSGSIAGERTMIDRETARVNSMNPLLRSSVEKLLEAETRKPAVMGDERIFQAARNALSYVRNDVNERGEKVTLTGDGALYLSGVIDEVIDEDYYASDVAAPEEKDVEAFTDITEMRTSEDAAIAGLSESERSSLIGAAENYIARKIDTKAEGELTEKDAYLKSILLKLISVLKGELAPDGGYQVLEDAEKNILQQLKTITKRTEEIRAAKQKEAEKLQAQTPEEKLSQEFSALRESRPLTSKNESAITDFIARLGDLNLLTVYDQYRFIDNIIASFGDQIEASQVPQMRNFLTTEFQLIEKFMDMDFFVKIFAREKYGQNKETSLETKIDRARLVHNMKNQIRAGNIDSQFFDGYVRFGSILETYRVSETNVTLQKRGHLFGDYLSDGKIPFQYLVQALAEDMPINESALAELKPSQQRKVMKSTDAVWQSLGLKARPGKAGFFEDMRGAYDADSVRVRNIDGRSVVSLNGDDTLFDGITSRVLARVAPLKITSVATIPGVIGEVNIVRDDTNFFVSMPDEVAFTDYAASKIYLNPALLGDLVQGKSEAEVNEIVRTILAHEYAEFVARDATDDAALTVADFHTIALFTEEELKKQDLIALYFPELAENGVVAPEERGYVDALWNVYQNARRAEALDLDSALKAALNDVSIDAGRSATRSHELFTLQNMPNYRDKLTQLFADFVLLGSILNPLAETEAEWNTEVFNIMQRFGIDIAALSRTLDNSVNTDGEKTFRVGVSKGVSDNEELRSAVEMILRNQGIASKGVRIEFTSNVDTAEIQKGERTYNFIIQLDNETIEFDREKTKAFAFKRDKNGAEISTFHSILLILLAKFAESGEANAIPADLFPSLFAFENGVYSLKEEVFDAINTKVMDAVKETVFKMAA